MARALVVAVLLAACAPEGDRSDGATAGPAIARPPGATVPAPTSSPPAEAAADPQEVPLPEADAPIPSDPRALAERLGSELRTLDRAIDAWKRDGDPSAWPPPPEVELRTLYVQRIVRLLATQPALARRTVGRVPHRFRYELSRNVHASAELFRSQPPVASAEGFRTADPEPADVLLRWFRAAEGRFGVDWELLAGVMLIETRFGRIVSRSVAGASGPMQFIPSTWAAYGMGGDVNDPRDAIMGAANYLRASGAPEAERRALYAYNPVDAYVEAVAAYADVMRRDADAYYAYYNWQVFVRTLDGDVRITGPGL